MTLGALDVFSLPDRALLLPFVGGSGSGLMPTVIPRTGALGPLLLPSHLFSPPM